MISRRTYYRRKASIYDEDIADKLKIVLGELLKDHSQTIGQINIANLMPIIRHMKNVLKSSCRALMRLYIHMTY